MECFDILINIFRFLSVPDAIRLSTINKLFQQTSCYFTKKNKDRSLLLKWKQTQDFLIGNYKQIEPFVTRSKSFFIHDFGLAVHFYKNQAHCFSFQGLHFVIADISFFEYGIKCCFNCDGNSIIMHGLKCYKATFRLIKDHLITIEEIGTSEAKILHNNAKECVFCTKQSIKCFVTELNTFYIGECLNQPGECLQFDSSHIKLGYENRFHREAFENKLLILDNDGYESFFDYKEIKLKPIDTTLPNEVMLFKRINNADTLLQSWDCCWLLRESNDKFTLLSKVKKPNFVILGYCDFDKIYCKFSHTNLNLSYVYAYYNPSFLFT